MSRRTVAAITIGALVTAALAGCGGARPAPPPAPEPAPPSSADVIGEPPPPPLAHVIGDPAQLDLSVCLVQNGRIGMVVVDYNPVTGDSTLNGRRFDEVYPVTEEFAAAKPWYVNNQPIIFHGWRYIKYGLPRQLSAGDVVPAGVIGGVTAFVEPGMDRARPELLYLPVNPYCEFQTYEGPEVGHAVRG